MPNLDELKLKRFIAYSQDCNVIPWEDRRKFYQHTNEAIRDFEQVQRFKVSIEYEDYGSGTSSFRDIFCYSLQDFENAKSLTQNGKKAKIEGIAIYLSTLDSIATWGVLSHEITKIDERGRLHWCNLEWLEHDNLCQRKPQFNAIIDEAILVMERNRFEIVDSNILGIPLNFEAKIDTFVGQGNRVFDALFFWSD